MASYYLFHLPWTLVSTIVPDYYLREILMVDIGEKPGHNYPIIWNELLQRYAEDQALRDVT